MTFTADLSQNNLIEPILSTELQYGELACGPQFLLDVKLFSHRSQPKSVSAVYRLIKSIYAANALPEEHLESLLSTIDRDQNSEFWDAKDNVSEVTADTFVEWLSGCCLSEEYYETEDAEENPYATHRENVDRLIQSIQSLMFGDAEVVKLYRLTDSNNENTPYCVYVAIGMTHTMVVISHWIL